MADNNSWWKGIADGFGSKQGANALIGLGTGLLSGNTFAKGLAAGGQGFMQGAELDQQYADEAAAKLKETEQGNVTRSWLEQQGFTDLVPLVDAGQAGLAYGEALKRMQPQAVPSPIKVGAGETLLDPTTYQPVYQGAPDPQDQFGNEKDLYAQYAASDPVKMYETVKGGYERVRQSAALQTGAGDMGLIYGYMKMLDPGSVVRESEFAQAAQAGSYGQQIQGMVQRVLDGQRLPEEVRQQFVQSAEGIYQETASNLGDINTQFSTRAQTYGVDPGMFIRQPESYQPIQGIVTMPNGNTVKPL
jgi:hypothetical protein